MTSGKHMRLSAFHMELAKRVSEGKTSKEILEEFDVSSGRLSVIKSNPLFKNEVSRLTKQKDDAYNKAIKVYEANVEIVANAVVEVIKNPMTSGDVKVKAAETVLNRLAQKSGVVNPQQGQELVFEQLLRVTKRTNGMMDSNGDELPYDGEAAYNDLMEDLKPVEKIEATTLSSEEELSTPDLPTILTESGALNSDDGIPSTGDNGGKTSTISPRLMELLKGVH